MRGMLVAAKQNAGRSTLLEVGTQSAWLDVIMSDGLLGTAENIRIRLGSNREIVSAPDSVFKDEHQEEARTVIYEAQFLLDYLEEFSTVLGLGDASFVAVSEPQRQTTFSYGSGDEGSSIVLTKAHRDIKQILKEIKE